MTATDFENWKRELGAARADSGEECGLNRFLDLIETARGGGLAEAKALVGTICSEPEDNGQGEAALSMLSEFPAAVQSAAVIEELVRLAGAGEDSWASTYLRKSEYLTVGAEGKATAFLHSNGAAFSLYTSTKASIACRS